MDRFAKTLPQKAIKKTLALGFPRRLPGPDKPPTTQTDYTQKFVLSRINRCLLIQLGIKAICDDVLFFLARNIDNDALLWYHTVINEKVLKTGESPPKNAAERRSV